MSEQLTSLILFYFLTLAIIHSVRVIEFIRCQVNPKVVPHIHADNKMFIGNSFY
ncbi:hypothetical protein BN000_02815 [Neobacillus massiliamazoniensis]|uniref:Uncharacterized protein n=1 Tax=Neobacillus massiliamazoniensis TaxID=1499688 RepID=A0A0U1NY10_9BACI|nr:hypothetical protein BN000_02815 [Neobacillus massiliamazoniensis]